jgi:hypothetical protein
MTQIFDDEARAIPVTIIKAGPVRVTQIKRAGTDGYDAIQIAFKEMASKHVNRAKAGHFAKSNTPPAKHIVEVRVDDPDQFQLGQEIGIGDVLAEGQKADVTGSVNLPSGTEMVMPGDNTEMSVVLGKPIAMDEGLRFAIREGGRTVGAGRVTNITK